MPTWEKDSGFDRDHGRLSPADVGRLQIAVRKLVEDLNTESKSIRPGLRVKGVSGHPGVWELTWAPDGRATFSFGEPKRPGEAHVIWRRCGGHEIFADP